MSDKDLVIQQASVPGARLILLFHGVGSRPEDLVPLGRILADADPAAWVVSVRSPEPCDLGSGWQWFSVRGVSEDSRPARIAQVMPSFVHTIRDWQARAGVDAAATKLIGFLQGAIMALESTQRPETVAAQVISLAGRFASPPRVAPAATQVHLLPRWSRCAGALRCHAFTALGPHGSAVVAIARRPQRSACSQRRGVEPPRRVAGSPGTGRRQGPRRSSHPRRR